MMRNRDVNKRLIIHVAQRFGDLKERVVFAGGCAAGLFISDPAMPDVRATQDVDVIVEVASRMDYYRLEEELREKGFKQDIREGAPVCRWLVDGIIVDVMPTDEGILGFSNIWYLPAIQNAIQLELEEGLSINLLKAPFFLATKIEAFRGRGGGDYMASHDMEDIVTLLDGRPQILDEIRNSPEDLKGFLSRVFRSFLDTSEFRDALPGHLPPDQASQARLPRLIRCIEKIAESDLVRSR